MTCANLTSVPYEIPTRQPEPELTLQEIEKRENKLKEKENEPTI